MYVVSSTRFWEGKKQHLLLSSRQRTRKVPRMHAFFVAILMVDVNRLLFVDEPVPD